MKMGKIFIISNSNYLETDSFRPVHLYFVFFISHLVVMFTWLTAGSPMIFKGLWIRWVFQWRKFRPFAPGSRAIWDKLNELLLSAQTQWTELHTKMPTHVICHIWQPRAWGDPVWKLNHLSLSLLRAWCGVGWAKEGLAGLQLRRVRGLLFWWCPSACPTFKASFPPQHCPL